MTKYNIERRVSSYDLECFLSSDPYLGPVSLGSLLTMVLTILGPACPWEGLGPALTGLAWPLGSAGWEL